MGVKTWTGLEHGYYHQTMHRFRQTGLWVAIIALVMTRVVGVHVHVCSAPEPGMSVPAHMDMLGGHADHHHDQKGHSDPDVDLPIPVMSKASEKYHALLPVLIFVLFLLTIRRVVRVVDARPPPFRSAWTQRPPLRAPPAF
ncbi:MAG: hypothetical protein SVU69_02045 [Pseudomonadota bacterium]|nr:hypothetical protein [Pseudomonadota bacterium]